MQFDRRWQAGGLWLLAGVPIVMSFLQAIFALSPSSPSDFPVLGGVVAALKSLTVFAEASAVFKQNPEIVPLLFMLVAFAWLVEGGVMFGLRDEKYANRAAGFVILFLVLFLLAYLPLLQASVPLLQLMAFMFVAVITAGASWGAVHVYDWDPDLDKRTKESLATARNQARKARQRFDEMLEQRVDESTRQHLQSVAPDAVEGAEEQINRFRQECDRVLESADDIASKTDRSPRERAQQAEILVADADDLSPEERVDAVIEGLASRLPDVIRREFGDLHIVSRYGEAYKVRNHTDSNTVHLPSIETRAQVGGDVHDLHEQLVEALDEYPLSAVATAIADAREHFEDLDSTITNQEEAFADQVEEARRRLDSVEAEIEAIEGQPAKRLRELLLEGRYETDPPPGPSAPDVEAVIADGKDELHACNFTAGRSCAEEAVETAGELISLGEFFRAIDETIADEGESIPLPPAASADLALAMRAAFERETDVTYEVVDARVQLSYPTEGSKTQSVQAADTTSEGDSPKVNAGSGDAAGRRATGTPRSRRADDGTPNPASIIDEAVYLLNELKQAADDSIAASTAEIQTEELPSHCTEPGVLETVVEFGSRQGGVKSFEVPQDAPPGYLTLTVAEDRSPASVVARIRDQYINNYDNT